MLVGLRIFVCELAHTNAGRVAPTNSFEGMFLVERYFSSSCEELREQATIPTYRGIARCWPGHVLTLIPRKNLVRGKDSLQQFGSGTFFLLPGGWSLAVPSCPQRNYLTRYRLQNA